MRAPPTIKELNTVMRHSRDRIARRLRIALLVSVLTAMLGGCGNAPQIQTAMNHENLALDPEDLGKYGLAFITPVSTTSREEDRQIVAFLFAKVLEEEHKAARVVSLSETLSEVNRAGLAYKYQGMYEIYYDTGMFPKETLKRIGEVTKTRYIGMISVAGFSQSNKERLSIFGLRLLDTKSANLRMFFQIWDSSDGSVAWEANQEVNVAYDTPAEKPVTFTAVAEEMARSLIQQLPNDATQTTDTKATGTKTTGE